MAEPPQKLKTAIILAALLLAAGMAVGGYFIGNTLYKSRVALNTADAKGLAERRVEADQALWTIDYRIIGGGGEAVSSLYERFEIDQKKIVNLLLENGFSADEITPGVINYRKKELRDENQVVVEETQYLTGTIDVETEKVYLVSEVRTKLNNLIAQGLDLDNNKPNYYFTRLNEIKPEMLKEATKNARVAADQFAENADVKVGGIRTARQGGFEIRDVGESYGDTSKIEKDVRVVTNVTFFLEK